MSDILVAIQLIEEFTEGINSFPEYAADLKTRSAVERQLGIIGEAVNKYQKEEPTKSLSNSRKIITFRNWLVHAYDSIDNNTVWAIIRIHLPVLKEEVTICLGQNGGS